MGFQAFEGDTTFFEWVSVILRQISLALPGYKHSSLFSMGVFHKHIMGEKLTTVPSDACKLLCRFFQKALVSVYEINTSSLYYKHITIVSDASRVTSECYHITLELSITILVASFTLIYDVYSTGITYDNCRLTIVICF